MYSVVASVSSATFGAPNGKTRWLSYPKCYRQPGPSLDVDRYVTRPERTAHSGPSLAKAAAWENRTKDQKGPKRPPGRSPMKRKEGESKGNQFHHQPLNNCTAGAFKSASRWSLFKRPMTSRSISKINELPDPSSMWAWGFACIDARGLVGGDQ